MFDVLTDETLRAAQAAARLLYDNHRALGLDPTAIKLDTLRVDIAVELENRATQAATRRRGHDPRGRRWQSAYPPHAPPSRSATAPGLEACLASPSASGSAKRQAGDSNKYSAPLPGLTTSHGSRRHGPNYLRDGVSLTMSSPPSRSSAEAACALAAVPAGAPGKRLPLRPQRAGVNARQWVPPDPEILRRVKAALARL
jgi:hypothetical protein